eukprot:11562272-Alexandrium_andersonii.AAC.1
MRANSHHGARSQCITWRADQSVPSHERVYLKVPFSERFEAMTLGAKWDPGAMMWYVAHGSDLGRLAKWP